MFLLQTIVMLVHLDEKLLYDPCLFARKMTESNKNCTVYKLFLINIDNNNKHKYAASLMAKSASSVTTFSMQS